MAGRVRSVLLRLDLRAAGRRCTCARNRDHVILKGELRLAVRGSGPASGEKGYCAACASEMINAALLDVQSLRAALDGTST